MDFVHLHRISYALIRLSGCMKSGILSFMHSMDVR